MHLAREQILAYRNLTIGQGAGTRPARFHAPRGSVTAVAVWHEERLLLGADLLPAGGGATRENGSSAPRTR